MVYSIAAFIFSLVGYLLPVCDMPGIMLTVGAREENKIPIPSLIELKFKVHNNFCYWFKVHNKSYKNKTYRISAKEKSR